MQKKLTTIKYSAIIALLILFGCTTGEKKNTTIAVEIKQLPFKVFTVQKSYSDTSWGYIIEHDNRVLIKQFSIPVLQGNLPFRNKQQAAMMGELVAGKLNNAQRPSITKKELDSLGIIQTAN